MNERVGGDYGYFDLVGFPNKCPHCHITIVPKLITYSTTRQPDIKYVEVFMACTNSACKKSFIAYYENFNNEFVYLNKTSFGNVEVKVFSEEIRKISESFIKIYNQSFFAEQYHLGDIAGVGYRKSLEFLIKDYIVHKKPECRELIIKSNLGNCINEYVDNSNIKNIAKRAAWLGNDETHYIKVWENKDVSDLKKLINLTVHWVESELLTEEIIEDMPDVKR